MNIVYLKNELIDTSGSCAIIILILNDTCYITNLGDSRALYSYNDGKKFYQISRDHKPNDPIEKNRIYLAGGSIYQTKPNLGNDFLFHRENMIERNEKLPYRIFPGCLSVSYILNYLVI
jgi:protein phosphatase 2C family protein 2/3